MDEEGGDVLVLPEWGKWEVRRRHQGRHELPGIICFED